MRPLKYTVKSGGKKRGKKGGKKGLSYIAWETSCVGTN